MGEMAGYIVACDALTDWCANLLDLGYRGEMECIIAKIFGSEVQKTAAIELFMKTHGGRSFLHGHMFGDNVHEFLAPCIYEGEGEMPGGGKSSSIMTLGYDPSQQRFVGTFVARVMTFLWKYSGTLDATQRILTLDTEGPSFTGDGTMVNYKDIIEFIDDDHRTLTSQSQNADGSWTQFMTAHYHRVK